MVDVNNKFDKRSSVIYAVMMHGDELPKELVEPVQAMLDQFNAAGQTTEQRHALAIAQIPAYETLYDQNKEVIDKNNLEREDIISILGEQVTEGIQPSKEGMTTTTGGSGDEGGEDGGAAEAKPATFPLGQLDQLPIEQLYRIRNALITLYLNNPDRLPKEVQQKVYQLMTNLTASELSVKDRANAAFSQLNDYKELYKFSYSAVDKYFVNQVEEQEIISDHIKKSYEDTKTFLEQMPQEEKVAKFTESTAKSALTLSLNKQHSNPWILNAACNAAMIVAEKQDGVANALKVETQVVNGKRLSQIKDGSGKIIASFNYETGQLKVYDKNSTKIVARVVKGYNLARNQKTVQFEKGGDPAVKQDMYLQLKEKGGLKAQQITKAVSKEDLEKDKDAKYYNKVDVMLEQQVEAAAKAELAERQAATKGKA